MSEDMNQVTKNMIAAADHMILVTRQAVDDDIDRGVDTSGNDVIRMLNIVRDTWAAMLPPE